MGSEQFRRINERERAYQGKHNDECRVWTQAEKREVDQMTEQADAKSLVDIAVRMTACCFTNDHNLDLPAGHWMLRGDNLARLCRKIRAAADEVTVAPVRELAGMSQEEVAALEQQYGMPVRPHPPGTIRQRTFAIAVVDTFTSKVPSGGPVWRRSSPSYDPGCHGARAGRFWVFDRFVRVVQAQSNPIMIRALLESGVRVRVQKLVSACPECSHGLDVGDRRPPLNPACQSCDGRGVPRDGWHGNRSFRSAHTGTPDSKGRRQAVEARVWRGKIGPA